MLAATVLALAVACATGAPHQGDDVPDLPDSGPDVPDAGIAVPDSAPVTPDSQVIPPESRIVILMIGDGMGRVHLEATSQYAHGAASQLRLQSLPVHGELISASLSGVTDSAAAATAMATGSRTYNGTIGLDRNGNSVPNLVEIAHQSGLSAGVISTAALPHATPAGFTAHRPSRHGYVEIADDQALIAQPEVMLGGGMQYFAAAGEGSERTDGGLVAPLVAAGYQVATTATELAAASPDNGLRLVGLFAAEHLDYTIDRTADCTQPSLADMSRSALEFLERDQEGFLLVIEAGRIDMASHANDLERAITETLAFDEAVAAVADWSAGRDDVTLVVTSDHESGGLAISSPGSVGVLPEVTWLRTDHTNARVDLYCSGPGCESFEGAVRDHTWLHAVLRARVTGERFTEPPVVLTPDGDLGDMRYQPVQQTVATGFGAGFNQLDALHVDADGHGLAVGIEGVFERGHNAVVVLLDVDFGEASGFAALAGAVDDASGRVDSIVSSLAVSAPESVPGFGADFALVVWGAADPHLEELADDAGLRGLVAPVGDPADLWWYGAATNFGEQVVAEASALPPSAGQGLETFIPWSALYPGHAGGVPAGARVALAAIMVNDDGGYSSNQALPPFAPGTANPGRAVVPLPGVVEFAVDADADGVADGDTAPLVW